MTRFATFCTLTALAAFGTGIAQAQDLPVPGAQFMLQWDLDGDGKVTPAEAREQRQNIFYMFDQDSDGRFSKRNSPASTSIRHLNARPAKARAASVPPPPGRALAPAKAWVKAWEPVKAKAWARVWARVWAAV